MTSKASAAVALFALAALTAYAAPQQGGRAGGAPRQAPSTQAAASTDPKKVIETMQDNLGMLRGMQRNDSVTRVEMWGENGSKMIGGRNVTLAKWKVSLNYTQQGMRFDYTHDGQRTIEVVADKYAWNEETPGGKATPMPAALQERQVQLVLTPLGMAKAAKAAADSAKVSVVHGTTVLAVTYDQYGDWNDDAKADVYLPKHIVQTQNGMTVLDLTITHTNTYNPYVIMPIPANVKGGAAGARSN